ncbi:MAG: serine protease AprX [Arcticibacterium sp.]|jgi:serine protease AprX
MAKLILFLFVSLFTGIKVFGQTYMYLVKFSDRISSPYSISNPNQFLSQKAIDRRFKQGIPIKSQDLPPNPNYLDSLKNKGAQVLYKTRWFNGALILATQIQKDAVLTLPFVSGIEFNTHLKQVSGTPSFKVISRNKFESTSSLNYGDATEQIALLGVDSMHNAGFHGEGMLVAVLDDGFLNANSLSCLDSAFDRNRVLEVYDFVDNDSSVFLQGGHGTSVLSCMSAFVENQLIAPAYNSEYVLYRTEDGSSETKAEEAYWLIAAERADSLGVDVINTSLGYNTFDNSADNYTTTEMDGNTTLITRASDIAASTGMVIVNSAGNSGGSAWNIITAPADGDSVLAIGAVQRNGVLASFSSRGNPSDSRVKPDIMAVGYQTALCSTSGVITAYNGTSFSSPLAAAMIAGLWQANPLLTSFEINDIVRRSGHIYANPNIDYGYGHANFVRADSVAKSLYPIQSFQSSNAILSLSMSPENTSLLSLKFNADLVGKSIRVTLIDLSTKSILMQENTLLATSTFQKSIPEHTFSYKFLLRVENLSEPGTIGIFKF